MTPASVRTLSAAAAIPATLVVLVHLAVSWSDTAGLDERRTVAFQHGIALAVVLAAVLMAARYASWMERDAGSPLADVIGIAGTIAVLANLGWVWRDGSNALQRIDVTVTHLLALAGVAAASLLVRRLDERWFTSPSKTSTTDQSAPTTTHTHE